MKYVLHAMLAILLFSGCSGNDRILYHDSVNKVSATDDDYSYCNNQANSFSDSSTKIRTDIRGNIIFNKCVNEVNNNCNKYESDKEREFHKCMMNRGGFDSLILGDYIIKKFIGRGSKSTSNSTFNIDTFSTYDNPQYNKPTLKIETGSHQDGIISLDIHNNSAVTSSVDKSIRIFDIKFGRLLRTIRIPIDNVDGSSRMNAVRFSKSGQYLIAGGISELEFYDRGIKQQVYNSIYIFEVATGRMLFSSKLASSIITDIRFTDDDNHVAVATLEGGLFIYKFVSEIISGTQKLLNLKLVAYDIDYGNAVTSISFSNISGKFVTASWDGYIRIYDKKYITDKFSAISPLIKKQMYPKKIKLHKVFFSNNSDKIAVMSMMSNTVMIANLDDLDNPIFLPGIISQHLTLAWSNDDKYILFAGATHEGYSIEQDKFNIDVALNPKSIIWKLNIDNGAFSKEIHVSDKKFKDMFITELNKVNSNNTIATCSTGNITNVMNYYDESIIYTDDIGDIGVINDKGSCRLISKPLRANFRPPNKHIIVKDYSGNLKELNNYRDITHGYQEQFLVSKDGSIVKFKFHKFGKYLYFDLLNKSLLTSYDDNKLYAPITKSKNFTVKDWEDSKTTTHNGERVWLFKELNFTSRALAFAPDDKSYLLGTSKGLLKINIDKTFGQSFNKLEAWAVNFSADNRYAVSAYDDGTIRWYTSDLRKPLITLYVHPDSNQWVMWTQEGYFDTSEGAADLIGYHLNQGSKKEASFISMKQLYDVYYRPDIVQAKFRGEDITSLISLTAEQALKNPPPFVTFNPTPLGSDSGSSRVCYQIKSSGGGIGEVRVFHNSKLIKSDGYYRENIAKPSTDPVKLASVNSRSIYDDLRGLAVKEKSDLTSSATKSKGDVYDECIDIEPIAGTNEVSVAAFNSTNTVQSSLETISVVSNRKPEEPHLYILSVGIDKYRDASINLRYAAKDAKDFISQLPKQAASLYKPQNIHLVSVADEKATKAGIMAAINDLSNKVKHGDSFIFFNASHGVLLQKQYYIVTADFDGDLSSTKALISSNEIVEMSKKIKSLSQLYIFDTCHAGGVDNIISGLYDARMSVLAKKMGLHIYASAGSVQTAMDGYKGNGLYTHTLLQGILNGKDVDKDKTGQVTVKSLGLYTKEKTSQISKQLGHPQTPYIINFGKDTSLFSVK